MKLYKFRSFDNFEFTADIFLNQRLYASDFRDLNDPMEGIFMHGNDDQVFIEAIIDEKRKMRICALSKEYDNPILWAHYAEGFKGICIEFEIDEDRHDLIEVNYSSIFPIVTHDIDGVVNTREYSEQEWARFALERKFEEWQYEKEYRIFSNQKYIDGGIEIKSIYLGMRINEVMEKVIRNLTPEGINIYRTEIDMNNRIVVKDL